MDEYESIPRRDALAGLGVLSLLALALVGTIVFRIVHSSPHHGAAHRAEAWTKQSPVIPATGDSPLFSEPGAVVDSEIDPARLPATPIPVASESSSNIPAASTAESTLVAPPPEPQSPPARPHFVAPASR